MDDSIVKAVEQIKAEIYASYVEKGLVASGNFGKELQIRETDESVSLLAPAYVYQMENGRRAGSFPPVSAIRQWIKDKNRNAGTNIPESAAFAIAYVIKRDGIKVPNGFNPGGVTSDIITDERLQKIIYKILQAVTYKITNILQS